MSGYDESGLDYWNNPPSPSPCYMSATARKIYDAINLNLTEQAKVDIDGDGYVCFRPDCVTVLNTAIRVELLAKAIDKALEDFDDRE